MKRDCRGITHSFTGYLLKSIQTSLDYKKIKGIYLFNFSKVLNKSILTLKGRIRVKACIYVLSFL
jgi:hypothetical protein